MRTIFIAAAMWAITAANNICAQDALYIVGGFNNWDIANPLVAQPEDDLYKAEIDFSNNAEFKMSTINPRGDWTEFDKGTLYPDAPLLPNSWTSIKKLPVSPNIKAPTSQSCKVIVDLADMRIKFSTYDDGEEPWSGTLPVMFITTEGGAPITSKENYLKASYWLDPMGVGGIAAIGSEEAPEGMQIRGRGNYTWTGFDKKPYRIKLDSKQPLMGMTKSKHFALLAHADDRAAGLRNALGFAASEAIGMPWTPATAPLELVVNGDYIGLYWLTETIRVDKDRVDVTEQTDGATTDVDGGWLVEIDNYDSDPHITVADSWGQPIWFTYKSPELLSSEQSSFLQSQMQSIQNAANACDANSASALVDFNILARYFIVNQLMQDMESFHGSCYLSRQRGDAEKWKFGPVWDFGNSFAEGRADNPRFIFDHPDFSQVWIGQFYAMAPFVQEVMAQWIDFLDDGPGKLADALSNFTGSIAAAAQFDAKRWPQYSHADVAIQSERLQGYLDKSIEWLKKQWGNSGILSPAIPEENLIVSAAPEGVAVIAPRGMEIVVAGIDARVKHVEVSQGYNLIDLAPGFYIINGKKVVAGM